MNNILELLEDRQNKRCKGKKDKRKFGLVLQGGGMRGAYTAGALAALLEYGIDNAFDHIIGSSAGALNGAYYLAYDRESLHHTYTDDLTNKNFVNLLRYDKKVDIDYLVDTVLTHKRPLNVDNLLKTTSGLHVMLTDAESGKKVDISDHKKFADIYEELRATAALPILYDKKVLVQNKYYIDGGVADGIPIDVALKLKCTDIFVILTQQLSSFHFDAKHDRLKKHLVRYFSRNQPPNIQKILPSNEKLTRFNIRRLTHPTRRVRFYVLDPSNEEFLISLATTDKSKVETLAKLGVNDMDQFLHRPLKLR